MTAMTQQSDGPGNDDPMAGAETPPSRPFKHTKWQKFVRDMFMLFGPAQTGIPPYATAEERENWRLANLPEAPRTSTAPPGYRMVEYRDGQGYRHRSLIPITPAAVAQKRAETAQPAKPYGDAEQD